MYKKHDNEKLFSSLEKSGVGLQNIQNYIPLYGRFFELNETNWNSINLNNTLYLHSIKDKETDNIVNAFVKNIEDKSKMKKKVFFKYSPLLDPLKYIIGKYDVNDVNLLRLPSFNIDESHEKTRDINNSAYVDSFFSYLSSKLLHNHKFYHGLDFYGSFLSIKENYPIDICDDIEYVDEFDFFHKNKNNLFTIDESYRELIDYGTRNNKERLNLENTQPYLELNDIENIDNIDNIDNDELLEGTFLNINISNSNDNNSQPDIIYETVYSTCNYETVERTSCKDISMSINHSSNSSNSNSSCSSRSSNSSIEDEDISMHDTENSDNENKRDDEGTDDEGTDDEGTDDEFSTLDNEENVIVKINAFPVQTIALECCDNTLDSLIVCEDDPLTDEEWESIVLQILLSLITYQKTFSFTHNDLHSNNIMYIKTDKPYLYYKVEGAYYKVPTFGRLIKIIDFGRAIYKFNGKLLCSDSFHPKGDAATQYNFPPYFNSKKPIIEPNFSFDLCRLGCSIYDCIVDDINQEDSVASPILKIIISWCKDDKGRNIMYKKNGDERYPDFKLYKMISRKVHKHVPLDVLRNSLFDKYKISKKKIGKEKTIMNIDEMPCYI